MTKGKRTALGTLLCVTTAAMLVGVAVSANQAKFVKVHGALHDASCVWNHYDAVMPSTSGHGSQEFWACCTHAGNFSLEEPEVTNPSQITDQGAFTGAAFNALDVGDDRYIPQLEAANALDAIAPVTVSDMGGTSGSYVKTSGEGHTFLNYKFTENGGGDIWMKYRYSTIQTYSNLIYILNNHDESGLVMRFDGRTEDDGIAFFYIASFNQVSNPGTDDDIPSSFAESCKFAFIRPSGVKANTDFILHFGITLTDATNNIFNVKIEAGQVGGTLYQASTGPEIDTYVPRSFNIEMGSSYSGLSNQSIRMSAKTSSDITISDIESAESAVVYKDASGNVLGKISNPGTAKLPNLKVANKTFLGWFDPKGNRVNNGDAISTKKIVTPRYVTTQTNMFVPSDTIGGTFAAAKGGWYESTAFTGEAGGQLPVTNVTDRYDVYFIYQFVSRTKSDNYAIFGFPFDFSDAQTRVHLRIDNPTNTNLSGYIYGAVTSLGNAGAAGTNFSQSGFRANGSNLLVHMAVYNASAAGLTLDAEIVNLGDGQVHTETRTLTFNTDGLYAINNPARNIFDLMKGNCEYRITDAF